MDNEAITFNQPTGPRSPSRREVLWNELARLHAQLGIAPPTATYAVQIVRQTVCLRGVPGHPSQLHLTT